MCFFSNGVSVDLFLYMECGFSCFLYGAYMFFIEKGGVCYIERTNVVVCYGVSVRLYLFLSCCVDVCVSYRVNLYVYVCVWMYLFLME